jgi:hypothetical protein
VKDFSRELVTAGTTTEIRHECLNSLQSPMGRQGYQLTTQTEDALTYNSTYRPWWTWLIVIFFFPIGLIAVVLIKHEASVMITFSPISDGTRIRISGNGSKSLVNSFEAMRFEDDSLAEEQSTPSPPAPFPA